VSTDPLRTDASDLSAPATIAERDAKIEQLLLAGLDQYFAKQYDQAINVWTRALFFDRSHARARAYIERARRAQAERQRESEELLHNGTSAYRNGDVKEARRLLQAALDAGAPLELAFPMLERLNQIEPFDVAHGEPMPGGLAPARAQRAVPAAAHPRTPRHGWKNFPLAATASLLVAVVAAIATLVATRPDWRSLMTLSPPVATASFAPVAREAVLAIPTRGEMALSRARRLAGSGELRDALAALDGVRTTDPQRSDADQLRSEIQRQLLRLAHP
jgi:tetratricopeptide (TPR) repeat protein